jgi:hypothetical protein
MSEFYSETLQSGHIYGNSYMGKGVYIEGFIQIINPKLSVSNFQKALFCIYLEELDRFKF